MEFILCIGDPKTRKTYRLDLDKERGSALMGKKIGDIVPGEVLGLPGYRLKITGGRDKDGFPLHPGVHGTIRKKILLSGGPGFRPRHKGDRRTKLVRGNILLEDVKQINLKVIEWGSEPIDKYIGKKEEGEGEADSKNE
ncbi:MAG TPA: 30S ribosomal protein S6e [Candidatus Korarchaeota archaeon]|nr:30S ribosomal protein S6e [Candidatus Korarchaeota archaeon]